MLANTTHLTTSTPDTAIINAVKKGDIEAVKSMLGHGKDPNICDNHGDSLLSIAAENGYIEIVRLLIKEYAVKPNQHSAYANQQRPRPLTLAVANDHIDIAEFLLENGASAWYEDLNRDRPLSIAAANGNREMLKLLLAKEPSLPVNFKNAFGKSSFTLVAEKGHLSAFQLLLDLKGDSSGAFFNVELFFSCLSHKNILEELCTRTIKKIESDQFSCENNLFFKSFQDAVNLIPCSYKRLDADIKGYLTQFLDSLNGIVAQKKASHNQAVKFPVETNSTRSSSMSFLTNQINSLTIDNNNDNSPNNR